MRLFFVLALALGALALFLSEKSVRGQIPGGNNMAPPGSTAKPSPTPAAPATPEPTPPDDVDDSDVVRVSSTLVVVPVSVTDSTGQPVPGLTVPDFRLDESGKTQEIAQIGNPEQVPLDIALLIDVSSSVSKKFDFELQAATRFLKEVLKAGDRAAIFAIEMEPRMTQPLSSADAASAALLTLRAPTTAVPTPFYDAIRNAARYLADNTPANHHRVVVVISDGDDNFSREIRDTAIADYQNKEQNGATSQNNQQNGTTPDPNPKMTPSEKRQLAMHQRAQNEVLGEVQKADVTFYSINPTGSAVWLNGPGVRAQKGMELVADGTGGTAFLPNKVEDLDHVFRQITAELRAQYLVQYYSSDETSPNGKFLPIKVQVPQRPELKVRARSGYYVKRK
jgi:Ca-activated chloride channel family protein